MLHLRRIVSQREGARPWGPSEDLEGILRATRAAGRWDRARRERGERETVRGHCCPKTAHLGAMAVGHTAGWGGVDLSYTVGYNQQDWGMDWKVRNEERTKEDPRVLTCIKTQVTVGFLCFQMWKTEQQPPWDRVEGTGVGDVAKEGGREDQLAR